MIFGLFCTFNDGWTLLWRYCMVSAARRLGRATHGHVHNDYADMSWEMRIRNCDAIIR